MRCDGDGGRAVAGMNRVRGSSIELRLRWSNTRRHLEPEKRLQISYGGGRRKKDHKAVIPC
jgi:hypothetical protein